MLHEDNAENLDEVAENTRLNAIKEAKAVHKPDGDAVVEDLYLAAAAGGGD